MSETTIRHGVAWRAHLADRYGAGYSPAYDYDLPAGPGNGRGWNAWMAHPSVPGVPVTYTEQWGLVAELRTGAEQFERAARRIEGLITARTILQCGLDAGTVPEDLRGKLAERIARTDAAIVDLWPEVTGPPPF